MPLAAPTPAPEPPRPSLLARLLERCASPRLPQIAALVATILALPVLGLGFFSDDHALLYRIWQGRPTEAYTFATGLPADTLPYIQQGPYGWWSDPELKFRFFRPLSSWMLSLDWRVWGKWALPYHAQALVWNALLVGIAALVLRRCLPPATAGLAALFYAADASRALPVLWISNRYALTGATFGWLALWAHLRGREGARWGAGLSVLAMAISLACGEAGLGAAAFLVARELFDGERAWTVRLRALLPLALLGLAWAALYRLGGYGARHSGAYIDPNQDLGAFLAEAPGRMGALSASLLTGLSADLWVIAPRLRALEVAVGAGAVLGAVLVFRKVGPSLDPIERRALAWMLPGAGLALLPVLATFPTDRLIGYASLGWCAAAAALIRWCFGQTLEPRPRWVRVVAGYQLFYLGLLHPLVWGAMYGVAHTIISDIDRVLVSPGLQEVAGRTLILPSASNPYASLYVPVARWFRGEELPRAMWPLTMDTHDHRISRPDDRTLTVEILGGEMMDTTFEQLVRSPDKPFGVGDRVELEGGAVVVDALGPGGYPNRISLHLDVSLDDPAVRILALRGGELVVVAAPPVGGEYVERWQPGPGGL